MKQISKKLFFIVILISSLPSLSDELHLTQKKALELGFRPASAPIESRTVKPSVNLPPHSLPWPVQFIDSKHTVGNSMMEYQNYGSEAYYHEGADLRVGPQGEVKAPIDGFLQGDYYSYVTDQNTGEDKKYTKPISEGGDDLYFEITIQTADQFTFEFHHVNANSLPKNILDLINDGGGAVKRGDTIGYASLWPVSRMGARYDHIHYNLISPAGVYMNTEFFSVDLNPDTSAPVIKNIFAIYKDKKIEVLNQKLSAVPLEFVVSAYDMKAQNIYQVPPTFIEAAWSETAKVAWDFTQFLTTDLGLFPDIREVYSTNLRLTDGRVFSTAGDYSETEFLFRLKLPPTATLPITLTVKDVSGNITQLVLTRAL